MALGILEKYHEVHEDFNTENVVVHINCNLCNLHAKVQA